MDIDCACVPRNLCLPFEELENDVHTKIENANVQFTRWAAEQSTLSSHVAIKHTVKDRRVIRSDRCRKIFALTSCERRSRIAFVSRNKQQCRIALFSRCLSHFWQSENRVKRSRDEKIRFTSQMEMKIHKDWPLRISGRSKKGFAWGEFISPRSSLYVNVISTNIKIT